MTNEKEILKIYEMINEYKRGKRNLKGYEYLALSEYLNSLENNK